MSHQHAFQLFDRNVFESGPYLRAFDALSDTDAHEHSLLTYLGSLLPNGKGVIDEPVSPSIPEIFRATKMSVSTVRRKLRSLEDKGYLVVRSVHYLNSRGKSQQGANHYHLTAKAFDTYMGVHPVAGDALAENTQPVQEFPSSSVSIPEVIEPIPSAAPYHSQKTIEAIDAIVSNWERSIGFGVGPEERAAFSEKFEKLRQPIQFYLERIERILTDPKALSVARNINFLCLPYEITDDRIRSGHTQQCDPHLPKNDRALLIAIDARLASEVSEASRRRLEILRETVSCCNFEISLKLYQKHILRVPTVMQC